MQVAIQTLLAEPPGYVRQKLTAERLPRLKATGAPAVLVLIKVLAQPILRVGGDVSDANFS